MGVVVARMTEARELPPASEACLVWHAECPPRTVDQYRRVAHSLRRIAAERSATVVAVTSSLPQEGKTLSTVNLAVALSESYRQRVLIVDADLRVPSVMARFDTATPDETLADWLARSTDAPFPVAQISGTLSVVPAAPSEHDPVTLLTLPRFGAMLSAARRQYDFVLVDTPPVGLLCDAGILDDYIDGFVLVVGAGRARHTMVKDAIDSLGKSRLLGLLLNRTLDHAPAEAGQYAHYYRASLKGPKSRS